LIAFHISSNSKTNNEKAFINFDAVLMHLMQSNFALKDPRVFYICVVARETCIDAKKLSWKLNPTFIFTKWNSINRSFTRIIFFSNFDAPKYLPIMFIGRNYISRVILVPSFKYYGQAITKYGIEKID